MSLSVIEAVVFTAACGAVIFFCRAFPFLFFKVTAQRSGTAGVFFDFVERVAPPAAMTVLAFNALGPYLRTGVAALLNAITASGQFIELDRPLAVFIAAFLTTVLHLWKRNPLISIFGGTAAYMVILNFLEYNNTI